MKRSEKESLRSMSREDLIVIKNELELELLIANDPKKRNIHTFTTKDKQYPYEKTRHKIAFINQLLRA